MATPKWQPGKLYPPGSLVVPRTALPNQPVALQNPGFETGDETGWDIDVVGGTLAKREVTRYNPYAGAWNIFFDTNGGSPRITITGLNQEQPTCAPGTLIRASVQGKFSKAGGSLVRAILQWYDVGGVPIGPPVLGSPFQKPGNTSERWYLCQVSAVAPDGTASVRMGFIGEVENDADVRFDAASWNYDSAAPQQGLIYKAVQEAAGYSDNDEPAWPPILGQQVIDNEVIWEAVSISRVVWEAHPIMVSGGTEPTWPTTVGERVADGTIAWEAVSRRVEDENCPNSKVVAILASKVFATDRDIVRFSATANPLDWTTERDAGYLPTGLQQANSNDMAVLAPYRGNLAPMNANCFQNWQVDPDPEQMALLDQMDGIGSTWQHAAQAVGNELFYLSQLGVRTVGIANAAENLAAGDVGMPIDPLVQAAIAAAVASGIDPVATYYPSQGQFWIAFPGVGETQAFVYSMTSVGKVGAWSRYLFPFSVDAFAQLGNDLYVRHGDVISKVSEDAVADEVDGSPVNFTGSVWWPWLDFGQPGVTKMLEGFDYVGTGQGPSISIGYDQRNSAVFTTPYQLENDTMPGGIIPLPVSAPTLSVKLDFAGGENWRVQSVLLSLRDLRGGP